MGVVAEILVEDGCQDLLTEFALGVILVCNPVHEILHDVLQVRDAVTGRLEDIVPKILDLASRIEQDAVDLLDSVSVVWCPGEGVRDPSGGYPGFVLQVVRIEDRLVAPADGPSVVGSEFRRSQLDASFLVAWLGYIVEPCVVHDRCRGPVPVGGFRIAEVLHRNHI